MKMRVFRRLPAASMLASALAALSMSAGAQTGAIDSDGAPTPTAGSDVGAIGLGPSMSVGSEPSDSGFATPGVDIGRTILGFGSGFGSTTSGIGIRSTTSGLSIGLSTSGMSIGSPTTSSLTPPSSFLGPVDLGTNPPLSSFGRFLPGVGPNASGTRPSPRLPTSVLDSTTSSLGARSSLLGPLDLGTNPPFSSFGRFLPGVGPNASGTRPSPRLPTPGSAPSAATSSGGVVFDSFCDPQDFTCDQ